MLKKLLKYDMRDMLSRSLPMFVASAATGLVCCALLYFSLSFSSEYFNFALLAVSGFYAIGIFAIIALFVISCFFAAARYYKSFFSDEGYLNMVIPAPTSSLLLAKFISVLIWTFSAAIVMLISLFLALAVPNILYDPKGFLSLVELLLSGTSALGISLGLPELLLTCAYFAVSLAEGVCLVLASITAGSMLMKNHKIVGSVLLYLAISFVQSIITSALEIGINYFIYSESLPLSLVGRGMTVLVSAATAAVLYSINLNILKNKFNIE